MPKEITRGKGRGFKRGRKERMIRATLAQVRGIDWRVFERTGADWPFDRLSMPTEVEARRRRRAPTPEWR